MAWWLRGRILNRGNKRAIPAVMDATEAHPGALAADNGFGGRVGLRMLLDPVNELRFVHAACPPQG